MLRIIASIEDPASIAKMLIHIERHEVAAAPPQAPRAPPATSLSELQ